MSTRAGTAISPGGGASTDVVAALSRWLAPVEDDVPGGAATAGSVTLRHFGYVDMITCVTGPLTLTRRPSPSPAPGPEAVALLVPRTGTALIAQDGRGTHVESGRLALLDLSRPFSVALTGGQVDGGGPALDAGPVGYGGRAECSRTLLFRLPVHALHVPAAVLRGATARVLDPSPAVAALLTPVLRHLDESAAPIPAAVAERLGGVVTDAVAALVGEPAGEAGQAAENGPRHLVLSVRRFIDRNLGDPELSAERIAAAHFISVRYLHRLFEGEDTTVSRLVQRRRVEECARELARRARVGPSLAVVASRWGFRSAAHFSRAFKGVHGHPPQQWRRLVLASPASGLAAPTATAAGPGPRSAGGGPGIG
ncbi:helix-turn-helix domain-containing protein [Streptomyces sp. NPDC023327]|uniref:helix-turn-helix domain-containing protein n=1 Tax=Streptomyces sp. NPDC023327 TaxID=3157088 RepID=UPI00340A08F4